jgi:hypothetical protein
MQRSAVLPETRVVGGKARGHRSNPVRERRDRRRRTAAGGEGTSGLVAGEGRSSNVTLCQGATPMTDYLRRVEGRLGRGGAAFLRQPWVPIRLCCASHDAGDVAAVSRERPDDATEQAINSALRLRSRQPCEGHDRGEQGRHEPDPSSLMAAEYRLAAAIRTALAALDENAEPDVEPARRSVRQFATAGWGGGYRELRDYLGDVLPLRRCVHLAGAASPGCAAGRSSVSRSRRAGRSGRRLPAW